MKIARQTAKLAHGFRAGAASVALAFLLAGCGGDGPSLFNFPGDDTMASGPVREPATGTWLKADVTQRQRDKDIAECRDTAAAQVARDRQIDEDRRIGQSTLGDSDASQRLTMQMGAYNEEQREARLFARCLRAKGYERR